MNELGFALGLVGWPVAHSLSPVLQAAALEAAELHGDYRCFPIRPDAGRDRALRDLVSEIRAGSIHGLNVTVPHKVAVVPLLDGLTHAASGAGAVNTLLPVSGRVVGDNTDVEGFLRDLDSRFGLPAGEALILGAGGAARAVGYGLARRGWEVHLANRTLSRALRAAHDLTLSTGRTVQADSLDRRSLEGIVGRVTLVVQATSAGGEGSAAANSWPVGLPWPSGAIVYDLVVQPVETPFLRSARQAGLRTTGGLGMLVEQAALSFERWTGAPAPRAAMRSAVESLEPQLREGGQRDPSIPDRG
jgi:shikimate dehydrogenase